MQCLNINSSSKWQNLANTPEPIRYKIFSCLLPNEFFNRAARVNKSWNTCITQIDPTSSLAVNNGLKKLFLPDQFRKAQQTCVAKKFDKEPVIDEDEFCSITPNGFYRSLVLDGIPRGIYGGPANTVFHRMIRKDPDENAGYDVVRVPQYHNWIYKGDWGPYAVHLAVEDITSSNPARRARIYLAQDNDKIVINVNSEEQRKELAEDEIRILASEAIGFFPAGEKQIGIVDDIGRITIWKVENGKETHVESRLMEEISTTKRVFCNACCFIPETQTVIASLSQSVSTSEPYMGQWSPYTYYIVRHNLSENTTEKICDCADRVNSLVCDRDFIYFSQNLEEASKKESNETVCVKLQNNSVVWKTAFESRAFIADSNSEYLLLNNGKKEVAAIHKKTGNSYKLPDSLNMYDRRFCLWETAAVGIRRNRDFAEVLFWDICSGLVTSRKIEQDPTTRTYIRSVCPSSNKLFLVVSDTFLNCSFSCSCSSLIAKWSIVQLSLPEKNNKDDHKQKT